MRDIKGQFIKNHPLLPDRDKTNGRFVKKTMDKEQERYTNVISEVYEFLKELE